MQRIAARHHRRLRAVGDERSGVDQRGRAGAEHRHHAIARDQRLGVRRRHAGVGLVVADDQLDHLLAAVDGDAARLVDLVDRALVAPLEKTAEAGERPRERNRRADHNLVGGSGVQSGPRHDGRGEQAHPDPADRRFPCLSLMPSSRFIATLNPRRIRMCCRAFRADTAPAGFRRDTPSPPRVLMQPARKLAVEIRLAHLADLRLGDGHRRIAVRDIAEPEARAHLAAVVGLADEMAHPAGMDRRFQKTRPRADGEMAGRFVFRRVESLGGIVKRDAQLVERAVLAGEIFVNEMRRADISALDPVLPAAIDVVGRMPQPIPFDVAEPGEPPVDHLVRGNRACG